MAVFTLFVLQGLFVFSIDPCQTNHFGEQFTINITDGDLTMSETRWNPEKPFIITAICVIALINVIQMVNLILSPMAKQAGAIYPLYFAASVLISLVCIAGLWLLKRWAALAYSAVLIINQLVLLAMGYWELTAAIIPVAIILLLFKHLDKMA